MQQPDRRVDVPRHRAKQKRDGGPKSAVPPDIRGWAGLRSLLSGPRR